MKYNIDGMSVNITLNLGAYTFYTRASTGKTYLAYMLRKLCEYGERCVAYTYGDVVPLNMVLDSSKYDIILLDRYDMYSGESLELIHECSRKSIVLIDSKREITEEVTGFYSICFTEEEILVW